MRAKYLGLVPALLCTGAVAAGAPQPRPITAHGALAGAKAHDKALATVVASPVVMVTRAVVAADGTIHYVCEQERNPHPATIPIARPAPEPQQ